MATNKTAKADPEPQRGGDGRFEKADQAKSEGSKKDAGGKTAPKAAGSKDAGGKSGSASDGKKSKSR